MKHINVLHFTLNWIFIGTSFLNRDTFPKDKFFFLSFFLSFFFLKILNRCLGPLNICYRIVERVINLKNHYSLSEMQKCSFNYIIFAKNNLFYLARCNKKKYYICVDKDEFRFSLFTLPKATDGSPNSNTHYWYYLILRIQHNFILWVESILGSFWLWWRY